MDLEQRIVELEKRVERLEKEAAGETTAGKIEIPLEIPKERLQKIIEPFILRGE